MTRHWLPVDFVAPKRVDLPGTSLHLRPIHPDDTELDMAAVMGSQARLWSIFGEAWGWPPATMTTEEDRADLARHAEEMERNESFNFAIFDADESALLGCVYIDPPERDGGADAEVCWWLVDELVGSTDEAAIEAFVPEWIRTEWPLSTPRYVGRDLSWAEWLALGELDAATSEPEQDDVPSEAASDIRLTFDRVPATYDRIRPTYPPALFDAFFDAVDEGPGSDVRRPPAICEVGPGTGQATRTLLDRGAVVTAVELGQRLAATLEAKLGCDALRVVNDNFETADLPLSGIDGIMSATAYHWIRPELRMSRPHELLRPGGVLATIELIQVADHEADRGYFERVQPIYDDYGQGKGGWTSPPSPDDAHPWLADEAEASPLFDEVEIHRIRWDQTYSAAEYGELLMSYSGTHMLAEPDRSEMVARLIEVITNEFDDTLTRPLVAALTIARRVG